jgi:hypothetical protein
MIGLIGSSFQGGLLFLMVEKHEGGRREEGEDRISWGSISMT